MKNDSFRLPFKKKVTNSVSADYHPACGFKNPSEIYSYFLEDSAFPSKHPPPTPNSSALFQSARKMRKFAHHDGLETLAQ